MSFRRPAYWERSNRNMTSRLLYLEMQIVYQILKNILTHAQEQTAFSLISAHSSETQHFLCRAYKLQLPADPTMQDGDRLLTSVPARCLVEGSSLADRLVVSLSLQYLSSAGPHGVLGRLLMLWKTCMFESYLCQDFSLMSHSYPQWNCVASIGLFAIIEQLVSGTRTWACESKDETVVPNKALLKLCIWPVTPERHCLGHYFFLIMKAKA